MKYITVSGEDITSVYDDATGPIPQGAIPIADDVYAMFRTAQYGFGEFVYRHASVIKREGIEVLAPPQPQAKPYGVEDLVVELLTLLEVSNVLCKDNLSLPAKQYLGMPESSANTFGKALGHPDFHGIGGELI